MSNLFTNHPLTPLERSKLHEEELKVVMHYEKVTKQPFMRYEVPSLKACIQHATPEAINGLISRFYYLYPQNFVNFHYIVKPVTQGMLKKSRTKPTKK